MSQGLGGLDRSRSRSPVSRREREDRRDIDRDRVDRRRERDRGFDGDDSGSRGRVDPYESKSNRTDLSGPYARDRDSVLDRSRRESDSRGGGDDFYRRSRDERRDPVRTDRKSRWDQTAPPSTSATTMHPMPNSMFSFPTTSPFGLAPSHIVSAPPSMMTPVRVHEDIRLIERVHEGDISVQLHTPGVQENHVDINSVTGTHPSIGATFTDGVHTLEGTIAELRENPALAQTETFRLTVFRSTNPGDPRGGLHMFSANNRRLRAMQDAGITHINIRWANESEIGDATGPGKFNNSSGRRAELHTSHDSQLRVMRKLDASAAKASATIDPIQDAFDKEQSRIDSMERGPARDRAQAALDQEVMKHQASFF